MSERVLKILLSELKTVRLVCAKCGGTAEMTVVQLGGRNNVACPVCNTVYQSLSQLISLARSIEFLRQQQELQLEFVIPDPS